MLHIADEVRKALDQGTPIVALESTIIAHGLPYPDNLQVARELEDAVRSHGAVPATIAILGGVARIGLDHEELSSLAQRGASMAKAGAADLAPCMAGGRDAATTVSGTSLLAA